MFRQIRPASAAIALLLGTVLTAPIVHADPYGRPPPPAYYAGGHCNGDDVGTVLGAVAGGVIGSNAAQGDAKVAGTVFGALLGGVIGHQIGRASDPDCNGRYVAAGRVAVPVQGYYPPPAYYAPPRPAYVVPYRGPAYVVPPPRRVYAAPYPPPGYRTGHRDDDRHGNRHRQDDRDRGHGDSRGNGH
jgi:hypothetical protein